ncbi:hypothetical protein CEXT_97791 [Caerostris extrusa]|uniref:Uncharacterized protein n=1 Tax=Caerostris extrusa TaxID=172846 RepID=A0AAV4U4Z1_CAEEX|nr:hypothetical protein CEXT_97791 [Caerostris extrusa]
MIATKFFSLGGWLIAVVWDLLNLREDVLLFRRPVPEWIRQPSRHTADASSIVGRVSLPSVAATASRTPATVSCRWPLVRSRGGFTYITKDNAVRVPFSHIPVSSSGCPEDMVSLLYTVTLRYFVHAKDKHKHQEIELRCDGNI